MDEREKKVYKLLEEMNIKYSTYKHCAVFTVKDADKLEVEIPGRHCKNLFLRNRKGDKHYLYIVGSDKKVNLKLMAKKINSTNLSFASSERLMNYLGVYPGAVSIFAVINDTENKVEVLIDDDLKISQSINFHPNVNTATINILYSDLERFLSNIGKKINYLKMD